MQIKGDSPEMVEYIGLRNLIDAVKNGVGIRNGKMLFGLAGSKFKDLPWGALDDVVMGGVSESSFFMNSSGGENGEPTGLFRGPFYSSVRRSHNYTAISLFVRMQVSSPQQIMVVLPVSELR